MFHSPVVSFHALCLSCVWCSSLTAQHYPVCVEGPLSTAFSTRLVRLRLATTKREQHTNPAASVYKAIVQTDEFACSLRCSYRTVCIPKHIPCAERSSRLRRYMSILKVRVCRAPRQVVLCRCRLQVHLEVPLCMSRSGAKVESFCRNHDPQSRMYRRYRNEPHSYQPPPTIHLDRHTIWTTKVRCARKGDTKCRPCH
jgi:hypothetical protein